MWGVAALVVGAVTTSTPTWVDRFAGSRVTIEAATTVATLLPDLQLTSNPYVDTGILLAPRFAVTEDWILSAQLGATVEWTNSDVTDTENELELSDLSMRVTYRGLPRVLEIQTALALDVVVPLSESSRASTLIVAPALSLGLSRAFALGDGVLTAGASVLYRRPLYAYTTPGVDVPRDYAPQCFGGTVGCSEQLTGVANARDVLSWSLEMGGQWGDFSPGVSWRMTHVVPYGFRDLDGVTRTDDRAELRVLTYFAAFVGYAVTEEVGVELGYQLARNLLGGDGHLANPIFDRYQDVRLYLGASYAL